MRKRRRSTDRAWWTAYRVYLAGPVWQHRRSLVLRRSGWVCERCGRRPAVQVHHLRYPRQCRAGSRRWLAQERLADLQAVCLMCHDQLHA